MKTNKSNQTPTSKISGLHLIMPANQKGGASKSTTLAEIAAALKSLSIPILVINLEVASKNQDTANNSLQTMLRGSKVTNVDCSSSTKVMESFGNILDVAEESNAVILMDVPGALMSSGNVIWKNLNNSNYFKDLNTFTLVGSVSNKKELFETAVHITNSTNQPNQHVLYRGWSDPAHDTKLEHMPEWKTVTKVHEGIIMPTRNDLEEDVIFGRNNHKNTPGLIKLREWYDSEGIKQKRKIRKPAENVLMAIDKMAEFLKTHYLPKI